jgi:hypothetical protein
MAEWKKLVPMEELRRLMLAEILKQDGCQDVTDVSISQLTDDRAESNWSVDVVGCGSSAPDVANRAAINAQHRLRRHYDLLTD